MLLHALLQRLDHLATRRASHSGVVASADEAPWLRSTTTWILTTAVTPLLEGVGANFGSATPVIATRSVVTARSRVAATLRRPRAIPRPAASARVTALRAPPVRLASSLPPLLAIVRAILDVVLAPRLLQVAHQLKRLAEVPPLLAEVVHRAGYFLVGIGRDVVHRCNYT